MANWMQRGMVFGRGEGNSHVLQMNYGALGLTDAHAAHWLEWVRRAKGSMLNKRPGLRTVSVDISKNFLGDAGLQSFLQGVLELTGGAEVLKAFRNRITTLPLSLLLSSRCLAELHLSHNCLDTPALEKLLVAVLRCRDAEKGPAYPLQGLRPLWLRIEQNPGTRSGDIRSVFDAVLHAGGNGVCIVDGCGHCNPHRCRARASPPAVHLTYVDVEPRGKPAAAEAQKHASSPGNAAPCFPAVPLRGRPVLKGCAWTEEAAAARKERAAAQRAEEEATRRAEEAARKAQDSGPPARDDIHFPPLRNLSGAPALPGAVHVPALPRRARSCLAYAAEAPGYLSVLKGAVLSILHEAEDGVPGCRFSSYVFAALEDGTAGWLPAQACLPA